jgi:hypothetical protein
VCRLQVILSGDFLALSDVDVAKWAVWLADNAYTNPEGWATIKKGLAERLAAGKLSPAEVEAVVVALHKSRNYNRDLFEGFSKVVKVSGVWGGGGEQRNCGMLMTCRMPAEALSAVGSQRGGVERVLPTQTCFEYPINTRRCLRPNCHHLMVIPPSISPWCAGAVHGV